MQPTEDLEKYTVPRASPIVGHSPAIQRAQKLVSQAARSHEPILVRGATGTGKELAIQTIHETGAHSSGPLLRVACRAVPEEANLFGVSGPFSRLSEAAGGTLFLDEIADLPPNQQTLLAALLLGRRPESALDTLKTSETPPLTRIAASTAKDLESLTAEGLFDPDLYRHFAPLVIVLPPLRERRQDIPALVDYFVTRDYPNISITAEALGALQEYAWPGNVRELEATILQAMVLARAGAGRDQVIHLHHLKFGTAGFSEAPVNGQGAPDWTDLVPIDDGWRENIDKLERALVTRSLSLSKGNKSRAAGALRIHRRLLYEKLRQFQLAK